MGNGVGSRARNVGKIFDPDGDDEDDEDDGDDGDDEDNGVRMMRMIGMLNIILLQNERLFPRYSHLKYSHLQHHFNRIIHLRIDYDL